MHRIPYLASRLTVIPLLALSVLTAGTSSLPAAAAETSVAEPASARDLEALRKELDDMAAELRRLRDERPAAAPEAGSAAGGDARLAEIERKIEVLAREIERQRLGEAAAEATGGVHGLGPAASKVYAIKRGVSIGGYGEMLYQHPADERDDGTASGRRAQLDFIRAVLYAGYKFNDRILFNSEIEFEHAKTGEGEAGEVAVEFAYLDFLLRPEWNVRAGLLLVPMGFLNELHEPPTYLGARRPAVENRIIPSTWRENGAGLFGEAGKLSWRAYVLAGLDSAGFTASGLRDGRQNGSESVAENLAFAGRLDWKPTLGSLLGGSVFRGNSAQGAPGFSARVTIFDLHGELRERGLALRALYTQAAVGDAAAVNAANGLEGAGSIGSRLRGGYVQAGYDLLARKGGDASLTPYVRWERLDTQARVPAGFERNPANEQRLLTLGLEYRPHPQVVVKGDYQDVDDEAGTGIDQLNLALGYIF